MAIVVPLRGITYNLSKIGDMASVIAPPYDVISEEDCKRYYAAHPNNIIRLILGEKRTGDTDWDNRYTRAADYFQRWQSEQVLIRSERPCLYLSSHTFTASKNMPSLTRWGIICLVRIEDEESRVVLPHEKTFSAHKDDRLRLMKACGAHFCQIFGLYDDPDQSVLALCKKYTDARPKFQFRFEDGGLHCVWELPQTELHIRLAEAFREKPIYIADGHHRYETSRNYRNMMRARHGRFRQDRAYEFTSMYLCSMQDRGLIVLASHRLVTASRVRPAPELLDALQSDFEIKRFELGGLAPAEEAQKLSRNLSEAGAKGSAIAFVPSGSDCFYILTLRAGREEEMGQDLHPSQKKLDVLVLSRLILQKALGFTREDLDDDRLIRYESDTAKALYAVKSGPFGAGFFLNPTRVEQVKKVADSGLVMPRKSTYFFPKVLSGLVMNRIDPNEYIGIPGA